MYLTDSAFAARIREWLKVLRKKNVAVIFATQSLADIAESVIAPAIIDSCLTRIFLPNAAALEESAKKVYQSFGLNTRQLQILQSAMPKRDYYLQCRQGARLFQLDLGKIAMAFCAAGSPEDQARITRVLARHGPKDFGKAWLEELGLADGDRRVVPEDVAINECKTNCERNNHEQKQTEQHEPAAIQMA